MITREAKAEIRDLIVKANMALHSSDVRVLREMLFGALHRATHLKLDDIESGHSMPLLPEEEV
jgi:hypothetical protein